MAIESINEFLSVDRKKSSFFYLKCKFSDKQIRRPLIEKAGYEKLQGHFNMPRVRIANTQEGDILVVKGIDAPACDQIVISDPELVLETFSSYVDDQRQSWQLTKKEMDEDLVTRNWRAESLRTLTAIEEDESITPFLDLPIVLNGVEYPPLRSTIKNVEANLKYRREAYMALCHGDEHFGNLLAGDDNYWLIDPGIHTGLNSPSSAINNIIGGLYLFTYRYDGSATVNKENNNWIIDYDLRDEFKPNEEVYRNAIVDLTSHVQDFQEGTSLVNEFTFVNILRMTLGWTNRAVDLSEVLGNGFIFAGIATEQYYKGDII